MKHNIDDRTLRAILVRYQWRRRGPLTERCYRWCVAEIKRRWQG